MNIDQSAGCITCLNHCFLFRSQQAVCLDFSNLVQTFPKDDFPRHFRNTNRISLYKFGLNQLIQNNINSFFNKRLSMRCLLNWETFHKVTLLLILVTFMTNFCDFNWILMSLSKNSIHKIREYMSESWENFESLATESWC